MTERRPGKPLLEDAIWIALLERYVRGETARALAREHGVSVEALYWQARNRGYRKMDRPDAVYRWQNPPPIAAHERRVEDLAFDYDPADPEGSAARALAQSARAAQEGRIEDHLRLNEAARSALRTGRVMGVGASGVQSPSTPHRSLRDRPLHPFGVPLPIRDGEDMRSPSPLRGEETEPLVLRPQQRPPEGAWSTWLFLGGRGAGKTLAGASWISDMADRCGRLALIGATLHDAREVMIGGPSGILNLPRWRALGDWPRYQASRRRLVFPNGAEAFVFSAEDPDSLRGPQFAAAWADEFCAWRDGGEVLAMVRMGLRLPLDPPPAGEGDPKGVEGARSKDGVCGEPPPSRRKRAAPPPPRGEDRAPRLCVTTTPRPTAALKALRAEASCEESHAPTADNAENLAPAFLEGLQALYGGTRRAAQELEGLVVEPEGGLFTAEMLAGAREETTTRGSSSPKGGSPYEKIVVAVDPTATMSGNACGIVVVARQGERAVVLADRSARGLSPEGWARRALAAAAEFGASEIVAEVNQGGEMVRAVLEAAGLRGSGLRFRPVRATSGKRARAEPVAALYEQGRVRHAGAFSALEEELMAFGSEDEGRYDLDRADALVWGVTALLLGARGEGPRIRSLDFGYRPGGLSAPQAWPAGPAWG